MEGIGLELINTINQNIDLIAKVVIPFEIALLILLRGQLFQREIIINLLCGLSIYGAFQIVDLGFVFETMDYVHTHALFSISASSTAPTAFLMVLVHVLIGDLCFYMGHRLRHTKYLFTLEHVVHHSSTELNFVTNLRFSFIVIFYGWMPLLVPIALGFDTALLLASHGLANAMPFFMHTDIIKKMGWLEYLFNTPSHHRVHHGSNPCYINKNFGGLLIIWDRIFGTYAEEIEPVVYGVSYIKPSANPLKVLFGGWVTIFKKIKWSLIKAAPR